MSQTYMELRGGKMSRLLGEGLTFSMTAACSMVGTLLISVSVKRSIQSEGRRGHLDQIIKNNMLMQGSYQIDDGASRSPRGGRRPTL